MKSREHIRTRSGEWYSILQKDMAIFVKESKYILKNYLNYGDTVGFFLDLNNADFISIILYQTCIDCGASVIRCGISEADKQLPVKNDILLDLLICTQSTFRYISNKVKYKNSILINSIENIEGQAFSAEGLNIYEFFNIPGFLILLDTKRIICPGYVISENKSEKSISIETVREMKGFKVSDYYLDLFFPMSYKEGQLLEIIYNYINLQIEVMLKKNVNGKIDCQGNLNLDSISMVEFLVQLEEEFEISIPIEKISKSSFKNLISLSELIYSVIMESPQ